MQNFRVLIVEDDPFVALDLEQALTKAGCDVCGVASSQIGALRLGELTRPEFAVVDINLAPGDGRVVARELSRLYGTAVLFATAQCQDCADLARTGAIAYMPKPYSTDEVPEALQAVLDIRRGHAPIKFPDGMKRLPESTAPRPF